MVYRAPYACRSPSPFLVHIALLFPAKPPAGASFPLSAILFAVREDPGATTAWLLIAPVPDIFFPVEEEPRAFPVWFVI